MSPILQVAEEKSTIRMVKGMSRRFPKFEEVSHLCASSTCSTRQRKNSF